MNIKVKQRDVTDCGAACLASVAAHYKLKLPVARLRQLAGTDKKGTNILGLIEAAQKLGFEARGVKGSSDSLFNIPKPSIAHVIVNDILHHFVVIYKTESKWIEIMDPADGQVYRKTHGDFDKQWTGALVLLLPGENFQPGNKRKSVISRFFDLIIPHKSILIQTLGGAVVYTLLGLSTSIFVQKVVDLVLVDGNRNLLNTMSLVMVILLAVQLFIGTAKSIFTLKTGQLIDAQLILGYYKHLLKLPQQFFDAMRVGEIISRINDAVKIRIFLNDISINLVVNIFIVIFSFILMFSYYWKLALIMLSAIPVYLLVYVVANKLNKRTQRKLMEHSAQLESQLVESINSIGTIKRFGLEEYANERTETRFGHLLKTVYSSGINSILSGTSSELIARLMAIVVLWVGAGYVLDNQITPGELLSFYTLIGFFTAPVTSLIGMNKTVQDAVIAADRLFEIMDLEWEHEENQVDLTPNELGDISFSHVLFRYGTRVTVFHDLNLTLARGEFTAIVGESGSGKSTLISLLQNIYPIQKGDISIGKYNLKSVKNSSLRRMVSAVPQQIDLFAGNVIENIALGDKRPDIEKIVNICRELGITDFIESLPGGFHTYLGENGVTLSGGQRQRIAIARALYRNPEILILDEATSSLDSTAENYVQQMINMLKLANRTVIIITHRLSTIVNADRIIVLEKGVVVEDGIHEELLNAKGSYYNLWVQQLPHHFHKGQSYLNESLSRAID